jgi:hypothetical protein
MNKENKKNITITTRSEMLKAKAFMNVINRTRLKIEQNQPPKKELPKE